MAVYRYAALNTEGKPVKGDISAESARSARAALRERGLAISDFSEGSDWRTLIRRGVLSGAIPSSAVSVMTRQMASLIAAGTTMERALAALIRQTANQRLRSILAEVRQDILEGSPFSEALKKHPGVFPPLFHVMAAAGEVSGRLDLSLLNLADYVERSGELRKKHLSAMIYPFIVTIFAFAATSGLLVYVIPRVVSVFKRTKQELPFLTRALIFASDFIRDHYALLAAGAALLLAVFLKLRKDPAVRERFGKIMLAAPVTGEFIRLLNSARLAGALSILVGGGAPLLESLKASSGVLALGECRRSLARVAEKVRQGAPLGVSLDSEGMFTPMLASFISNGESGGAMAEMLSKAASQQEKELEARVSVFTALLEPALILITGLLVFAITMAVLLPLFKMNQMAR